MAVITYIYIVLMVSRMFSHPLGLQSDWGDRQALGDHFSLAEREIKLHAQGHITSS